MTSIDKITDGILMASIATFITSIIYRANRANRAKQKQPARPPIPPVPPAPPIQPVTPIAPIAPRQKQKQRQKQKPKPKPKSKSNPNIYIAIFLLITIAITSILTIHYQAKAQGAQPTTIERRVAEASRNKYAGWTAYTAALLILTAIVDNQKKRRPHIIQKTHIPALTAGAILIPAGSILVSNKLIETGIILGKAGLSTIGAGIILAINAQNAQTQEQSTQGTQKTETRIIEKKVEVKVPEIRIVHAQTKETRETRETKETEEELLMAYNPRNDRWRIVIATVKENVATASRKKDAMQIYAKKLLEILEKRGRVTPAPGNQRQTPTPPNDASRSNKTTPIT